MNLSHYVLLKSFFVTATVVWAEIFSEVEKVFFETTYFYNLHSSVQESGMNLYQQYVSCSCEIADCA
jgi:hypothetical protein